MPSPAAQPVCSALLVSMLLPLDKQYAHSAWLAHTPLLLVLLLLLRVPIVWLVLTLLLWVLSPLTIAFSVLQLASISLQQAALSVWDVQRVSSAWLQAPWSNWSTPVV